MAQTLSSEDVEAIALRVVQIIGTRLGSAVPNRDSQPAPLMPVLATQKLAYPIKELMAEFGVSRSTIWKWEVLGLLKPVPYLRHKIYARNEIERFLKGQAGSWSDSPRKRRRQRPAGNDATKYH